MDSILQNRNTKNACILQIYHATVKQSWMIVPNRTGYSLVSAYNIRDDDQISVKSVQRRFDGTGYTVMFNDNPNGELDLWLTWMKIGTTESPYQSSI